MISGGKISSQAISDIVRGHFPELTDHCPRGTRGVSSLPQGAYDVDVSDATEMLGLLFRPVEETFVDLTSQLLHLNKGPSFEMTRHDLIPNV